jgi:hypothetical protein
MLIVCAEQARVEAELVGGRLGCPSCRGMLGPWGHARERVLRCSWGGWLLRPLRARCRGCAGTHVLLPGAALSRRQDEVSVIGRRSRRRSPGRGIGGSLHGWGCTRTRSVAGCAGSLSVPGWSGRISRAVRWRWIRSWGRCCRPGAASRMRWRRSRSPSGRGCCGSGRVIRGGSPRGCRAGCCWQHELPPIRGRGELGRSRARERERGQSRWVRTVAARSAYSGTH